MTLAGIASRSAFGQAIFRREPDHARARLRAIRLHFRNNNRGYVNCTLTPETWTSEYRIVDTVLQPTSPCHTLATFVVENGHPGAQLAGTPGA